MKSALEILKTSVTDGEKIPETEFEEIFTDTSGYRGVDRGSKIDLVQLVHRHLSEIELLQEYGRAAESLARNKFVQRQFEPKTDKDGKPIENLEVESVGRIYVARFLRLLIKGTNSLEFNEQAFDNLYLELEDFLASENLQYTFLAPIHNFSCATDRVQLTDEIQIKRLTVEELSIFLEANKSGLVPLTQLLQFRFAVSYAVRFAKKQTHGLHPTGTRESYLGHHSSTALESWSGRSRHSVFAPEWRLASRMAKHPRRK